MTSASVSFEVGSLLDELAGLRRKWDFARQLYHRQLAPDFRLLQLFDPKETFLSRLIGFLLDPAESHAQGGVFLEAFLKTLKRSWSEDDIKSAIVSTEKPGRIDIYVQSNVPRRDTKAIAIENKLRGAADQKEQITKYFDTLSAERVKTPLVVYLTQDGQNPANHSIAKDQRESRIEAGELFLMNAQQLDQWLKVCLQVNKAEPVRHFIQAFHEYVERNLIGIRDEHEEYQMVNHIVDDPDRVRAFISAIPLEWEVKSKLLDKFKGDLKRHLEGTELALSEKWWIDLSHVWSGFAIYEVNDNESGTYAKFQFDQSQTNALDFGLYLEDRNEAQLMNDPRRMNLIAILEEEGETEDNWAWWENAPHNTLLPIPRDWRYNPELWMKMANDTLAPAFITCADVILKAARGIKSAS